MSRRDGGPVSQSPRELRLVVQRDEERSEVLWRVDEQDRGLVGEGVDGHVAQERLVVAGREAGVILGVRVDRSRVQPREGLGGRRTAWTGAGDRVTLKAWYRSRDLNPDEVALNGV